MALILVTGPAGSPITVSDAKDHMRVSHNSDDSYILGLIQAVTRQVETFTNRALIHQTWNWKLDSFPEDSNCPLEVPKGKLSSVTSVTYTDTGGASQTWDSSLYTVDTDSIPGRILPAYGEVYPSARDHINVVTVQFVAGYGSTSADVPEHIKHAIKMLVHHYYDNRLAVGDLPAFAEYLLWDDRIFF